jgi:2-polyprenyl-6-methoxyphenol hydroxylase-like FAD-dependent oxidoreductase
MGGSIAGLLTARVLSDFFRQVTIVERDVLPPGPGQRQGVPHGGHTHGLLAGGRAALERFFPGITQSLVEAGALRGDAVRDFRWFFEGDWLSRPDSGLDALFCSRPLLESIVRSRVLSLPNVRVREGSTVLGLASSDDGERVTGVRLPGGPIAADLVADATGRSSRTPQWLEQMGYEKPRREVVTVGISYTTRFFARSPGDLNGDLGIALPPTPKDKRGGVILAQEGNRWTVTLISHFGPGAPEDLDGFCEFARTLPSPDIYDVIRHAAPLGDASLWKFPSSVRTHYDSLSRFPDGYLVIGDALCSFNPIYGQGMSVAALEAAELHSVLADGAANPAGWFFARARKVIDIPWSIAVGSDLRMPDVLGQRSLTLRLMNRYISRLHRAAHTEPAVALAFNKVSNLLGPPATILHPGVVLRVIRGNLSRASRRAGTTFRHAVAHSG